MGKAIRCGSQQLMVSDSKSNSRVARRGGVYGEVHEDRKSHGRQGKRRQVGGVGEF